MLNIALLCICFGPRAIYNSLIIVDNAIELIAQLEPIYTYSTEIESISCSTSAVLNPLLNRKMD